MGEDHPMRRLILLTLLGLTLLPALAEPLETYRSQAYRFSFHYPANFELQDDEAELRKIMDIGSEMVDTSRLSPELRDALAHLGPQFLLTSPSKAVMVCISAPVSEAQLGVPTLELARASLEQAIVSIPGSRTLSEPAEVMVGPNRLVRYELELLFEGEAPTRQVQYMVRNSDLRILLLFGITSDSRTFATDAQPFETILESLQLDFASGERGEG